MDYIKEKNNLYNEFYNYIISDEIYNYVINNLLKNDIYKTYYDSPLIYNCINNTRLNKMLHLNLQLNHLKKPIENDIYDTESFNFIKYINDKSNIKNIYVKYGGFSECMNLFSTEYNINNENKINDTEYKLSFLDYKSVFNNSMCEIYTLLKSHIFKKIISYINKVNIKNKYDAYFILKYLKHNSNEISKYFLDFDVLFGYNKNHYHYVLNPQVLTILNKAYKYNFNFTNALDIISLNKIKSSKFPSFKNIERIYNTFDHNINSNIYNMLKFNMGNNKRYRRDSKNNKLLKKIYNLIDPLELIDVNLEFTIPYIEHFNSTLIINKENKIITAYIKNCGYHKLNVDEYIFPIMQSEDFKDYKFEFDIVQYDCDNKLNTRECSIPIESKIINHLTILKDCDVSCINLNLIGVIKKDVINSKYNSLEKYIKYRCFLSQNNSKDVKNIDPSEISKSIYFKERKFNNLDVLHLFNLLNSSSGYRSFLLNKYSAFFTITDLNYFSNSPFYNNYISKCEEDFNIINFTKNFN